MIRIVIADDHPVVRAGIAALLELEPELTIVAAVATPDAAVDAVRREQPDLVLMDLQFGAGSQGSGVDATGRIRALPDPPPVLILTNYDTDADILGAVEAGASGYLLKDAPPHELVAAVRAAAAGESALAPVITARLLDRMRGTHVALSHREIEVLEQVASGRSNAEIAAALFVSETTVKSHLAHVYSKLGVDSRAGAVAAAIEQRIIRR